MNRCTRFAPKGPIWIGSFGGTDTSACQLRSLLGRNAIKPSQIALIYCFVRGNELLLGYDLSPERRHLNLPGAPFEIRRPRPDNSASGN